MKNQRRLPHFLAPLLVGWLLVMGCASAGGFGPIGRGVPGDQRHAYDGALAHLPADPAAAEAALEQFLDDFPDSRLSDDAAEQLARITLLDGRRDDAFKWLEYVVDHYPEGDRIDSVRLRLARWEHERGDEEKARQLLDRVRESRLVDADKRALQRLFADMAVDPVEKISHLARLRESTERAWERRGRDPADGAGAERLETKLRDVDAEIDTLLLDMTDAELLRASADLRSRIPAGRVRLMLARRALGAGNFEGAQRFLDEAQRYRLTPTDEGRLASLELRLGLRGDVPGGVFLPTFAEAAAHDWPELDGVHGTLGVVLPLSGRYASFGQEALRGILLAAGTFDRVGVEREPKTAQTRAIGELPLVADEQEPASRVRLIVRDTQGNPELAAAAIRELADIDDVIAIIGPIFSVECEAAAREAEREKVPLLTLSNRVGISSERDFVFRMRTTPEDEVGFLVEYAVNELGAEQFAVLYPQSRYGRGMRTRYWQAVEERGGQIVAAAGYEPDATDMSDAIRAMIGYSLLTPNERVALQERDQAMRRGRRLKPEDAAVLRRALYPMLGPEGQPLPPIIDFDALFVPDGYDKVQLIAPQLALHEVDGVHLLGSSEWNDPELLKVGARHMRGAVISTTFDRESEYEIVRDFVLAYQETFDRDPDAFSSGAFDAVSIALTQLAGGSRKREQVRDGILRVHGYPGVSGVTSIQSDGNARKRPFLLGISRGRFVALD
ncbi:MAG: penicillin-binding protein activator [Deltaproteobacteria bacterium]|nr:penicillin-binding protein activator [Deltaproteobacteria bacterium]MBW2695191.1 penicillin-binding protein activator [Deltaproteobacteria bacterium]